LLKPFKIEPGYYSSVKWGGYALGLSFLRQIFLVPVFIITVGSYGYSFWLILSTVAVMITALNLGHLHYSANLINFIHHKNEDVEPEMIKIQGATYVYGLLQLLFGVIICFTPVLSYITSFPESYIVARNAGIGFILLLAAKFFLQYISMFVLRLFEPLGRINTTLKYQAIGEALDLAATLSAIYITRSIFYTCLAVFIVNIIFSVIIIFYVAKHVPFKLPFLKNVSLAGSYGIIKGSVVMNSSFLIEKVYDVGLNLVVVRVFGASAVPLFTTGRVLTNIFYRLCTVMVIPLFPVIQKDYALDNRDAIMRKMKIFWTLLSVTIIFGITIGMPFLPYVYSLWTHNKLQFNLSIICYLFMAVSFQNFVMIVNEFFKKANLSKQILFYNIAKSVITITALVVFGYYNYLPGLGIALFIADALCSVYSMLILLGLFKDKITARILLTYLLPVILFCISLMCYLYTQNYWVFLLCNIVILFFFNRKKDLFKNIKKAA